VENRSHKSTNVGINRGIVGCAREAASEGTDDVVRPGRCGYKPFDSLDSLAHREDVEFGCEVLGVDQGLVKNVVGLDLDRPA